MAEFYWLASYPKSGNTWMRVLLTNYLLNSMVPASINRLERTPIASSRVWFDEWAGVEASALNDITIERLRPDVYRCMAREESDNLFMKVHDAWGRNDRGEGIFPADVTGGVVYILRNPLDMVASCANHFGISMDESVECLCDKNYALSRTLGGISDQLYQRLGSWSDHVTSWIDKSGLRIHLVRYEDLKQNTEQYFGQVVCFCGLPYDAERLRKAVAFSDFSVLQQQENVGDFREKSPKSSGKFFRRGEAGVWRDELAPELVQKLIDAHGETMRRFGYLDDNNQPV